MSAILAMPCIVATATAVAEEELPRARAKPIRGLAFYRKHTLALLQRYIQISMAMGRTPSGLGRIAMQGRVSSYRLRTFEDGLTFVIDVEKCINQLDRISRKVVTHVALEDYTILETVSLIGESERTISRIFAAAIDRLTDLFLCFGLLEASVENLSRGRAKLESNDPR
jgi:hypothetical protein